MVQDEMMRKGPWTEQEDMQLVCFVGLFGDRRWDFIAKVSGLNRTGKSCRLRWVNYLHPGLKRGKLTPQEERLVLELHSKWGNRWSRIARKLPGRTDNEIKNYWRTYMRKKAQEKKQARSLPSVSSSSSNVHTTDSLPYTDGGAESFFDTEGHQISDLSESKANKVVLNVKGYSMDDIWKDIELSDENTIKSAYESYVDESCHFSSPSMVSSALEYCPESLWKNDESSKMFPPLSDQFLPFYENVQVSLTG